MNKFNQVNFVEFDEVRDYKAFYLSPLMRQHVIYTTVKVMHNRESPGMLPWSWLSAFVYMLVEPRAIATIALNTQFSVNISTSLYYSFMPKFGHPLKNSVFNEFLIEKMKTQSL